MNNFKIIYRILRILEKSMDFEEPELSLLSYDALEISKQRWEYIFEMLFENGYIKDLIIINSIGMKSIKINQVKITLKGLEYLSENSFMKKAANAVKGIADYI